MKYQASKFEAYRDRLQSKAAPVSGTYRADTFDPDRDDVVALIDAARANGVSLKQIINDAGICAATVHNWQTRKTRRPCHSTMNAVLRALGKKFTIVDIH